MVKYVVRLPPEERAPLLALVNTGRAAAGKRLHARLLLKAEVGADRCPWSDAALAEALDTSASTGQRVRQAFGEPGLDAAVSRQRPPGRQSRQLDGVQEAQWLAGACRAPLAGSVRWTLTLLADKLVALDLVDTIRPECVRTTLKKLGSHPGSSSTG
jgi:hypothetical protein